MKTTTNENLADWLSRQTGISLRRLALWLGIDQSVLTRWRQQERLPPADALLQLVDAWKTLLALPEPALEANPPDKLARRPDETTWQAEKALAAHGPGVWKVLETESESYRFGAARFAALAEK